MDALAPFLADPARAAILLDVDGTLAPIVRHPSEARVPARTRTLLAALVARYGLVACISGRAASDAAALVGVPGVAVAGNHGLDELRDGVLRLVGGADAWRPAIAAAAGELARTAALVGAWVEDKGATVTVHVREAPDPATAAAAIAAAARAAADRHGLIARDGRMAVELLPPLSVDKGAAVDRLLAGRGLARSLYIGDDRTDIDAFARVDLAIAVRSDETPAGLVEAADLVVAGVAGVAEVLERLAGDAPAPGGPPPSGSRGGA